MCTNIEVTKLQVEIWKQTIEVQKHFNDIEMRVRNLCLTILGTLLGAAAVTSENGGQFNFVGQKYPISAYLLVIAFVIVVLFWFMDAQWYHQLLRGAVAQGSFIEKKFDASLGAPGLTQMITEYSHLRFLWMKITSGDRLNFFYGVLAYVCLGLFLLTIRHDKTVLADLVWIAIIFGIILIVSNHIYNALDKRRSERLSMREPS